MMRRNNQDDRHVIVVSYDAFSADNWEAASRLPHLSSLIGNGAYCTDVRSVYPSLTYVIHSTYVTGVYPDKHGVYHNNPFQPFVPEADQRWFWHRSDLQAPTIYDKLRERGMTSAGLLWPVSGKSAITYNIPEIRAILKENQAVKILKNGSPLYSLGMELKYGRHRQGIRQPYLDDFTTRCAVDTIRRKRPNLLLMHLIELDDAKHALGTRGAHIGQVIERMDNRLGLLIQAVDDAGIREKTTFIVIGDHGHKDVRYKIHLNRLLFDTGLIFEDKGSLHWRAYVQGAGGSAYLHIREGDSQAEAQALQLIAQVMQGKACGIERIQTREELDRYHVEGSIRHMLEAEEGYCFEDGHDMPLLVDLMQQGKVYSTHGYAPDKPDYTSIMVVSGEGIKDGCRFEQAGVVDLAPTVAKLLGLPFGPCDGRVLREIFKSKD